MPRLFLLSLAMSLTPIAGAQTIGFRTDGTGRYVDAKPPLNWGPDKNVVWRVKLTQSNAIPIIVGDKLFTCAEPCVLLCLDKADGKILWQHESRFNEIVVPDRDKARFESERDMNVELAKRQSAIDKESSLVRKRLKDGAIPKDEAEEKLDQFKTQSETLRTQRAALTTYNRFLEPGKGAGGFNSTAGYTSATPVTDGKNVFVLYGNGLVAKYDFDGRRLWLKLIEQPTVSFGHSASPRLVQGKLLVHFSDLVALDPRDGGEIWRTKIPPNHGTSMPARLGDVDVVFHPTGHVIRVSDGAILTKNLGSTGPNSPLVQDGKVFYVAGQIRAYSLPTSSDALAKWEPLWKAPNLKGGGYWFPSPILHEGLIYALNANSILTVVDAANGKIAYEERLEFGGGQSYPSITLAGNRLYVSSDNGTTLVLEPGREYKELARNTLETFRSSLVFEGRRMFVRTTKGMWCIGE